MGSAEPGLSEGETRSLPGEQSAPGAGRYAPSPSGDLHLGNLRTAVLAWLFAKHTGREFRLRVDDIDAQRSSEDAATRQLADLAALGITHDGPIVHERDCLDHYEHALKTLADQGRVYECYCSRKDIQEASRAPHAAPGAYPGTCRNLSEPERATRRAQLAEAGRSPALRLRAGSLSDRGAASSDQDATPASGGITFTVTEWLAHGEAGEVGVLKKGTYTGQVDDMVLRRGGNTAQLDGSEYAYNLAVVVDDALAGVDQVVRGDDLLSSAPRQAYLAQLLGIEPVEYVHVPLVLGPEGKRLAKRDGAVTMREVGAREALAWIGESLGAAVAGWGGGDSEEAGAGDAGTGADAPDADARHGGASVAGDRGEEGAGVMAQRVREAWDAGVSPAEILAGWAECFRPELLPRGPVTFHTPS